jgi:hypothetical protein
VGKKNEIVRLENEVVVSIISCLGKIVLQIQKIIHILIPQFFVDNNFNLQSHILNIIRTCRVSFVYMEGIIHLL